MSDHNDGAPLCQRIEGRLHLRLVVGVCKGGCLIQNQHRRVFQHGAGDGQPLGFAAGEVNALRTDDRAHAVRKFLDDVHALRGAECRQHFPIRGVRLAHAHVIQNTALDEAAVLEHEGNRVHQFALVDVLYIRAADGNFAALRVKEAGNERRQRGFSAAGRADKRHRLPRADGKGDILQRVFHAVIAERDMIQRNRAVLGMLRRVRAGERRAFQYTVNAGDGVLHNHAVFAHKHQLGQRQGDDRRDDDVKEQVQQRAAVRAAAGEQESVRNQEHKHAVDRQRIEDHGPAQLLGVGDDPALIVVDRPLEFLEGKHRLPEGLDHGNTPHILHRFA